MHAYYRVEELGKDRENKKLYRVVKIRRKVKKNATKHVSKDKKASRSPKA
jgi:hypothetical protein